MDQPKREGCFVGRRSSCDGTGCRVGQLSSKGPINSMLSRHYQAASQSIEDSAALAEYLSQASVPSDIPFLTNLYSDFRKPRTERIQKLSKVCAVAYQLLDGQ